MKFDMTCGFFGIMCRDCHPNRKHKKEEMDAHPVAAEKQLFGIWIAVWPTVTVSEDNLEWYHGR
jgi:hypothetical protein